MRLSFAVDGGDGIGAFVPDPDEPSQGDHLMLAKAGRQSRPPTMGEPGLRRGASQAAIPDGLPPIGPVPHLRSSPESAPANEQAETTTEDAPSNIVDRAGSFVSTNL